MADGGSPSWTRRLMAFVTGLVIGYAAVRALKRKKDGGQDPYA